jgi:hypothetical protein
VVVLLGVTKNVRRNETSVGLKHTQAFVNNNSHTNVILMRVPYRYDLHINSCVNKEVTVFNRKLRKQMKVFENTVQSVLLQRKSIMREFVHCCR